MADKLIRNKKSSNITEGIHRKSSPNKTFKQLSYKNQNVNNSHNSQTSSAGQNLFRNQFSQRKKRRRCELQEGDKVEENRFVNWTPNVLSAQGVVSSMKEPVCELQQEQSVKFVKCNTKKQASLKKFGFVRIQNDSTSPKIIKGTHFTTSSSEKKVKRE